MTCMIAMKSGTVFVFKHHHVPVPYTQYLFPMSNVKTYYLQNDSGYSSTYCQWYVLSTYQVHTGMYWLNYMYYSRYAGSICLLEYHHILIQYSQPHLTQCKAPVCFISTFQGHFVLNSTYRYVLSMYKYILIKKQFTLHSNQA
jgi:hypothetical protein